MALRFFASFIFVCAGLGGCARPNYQTSDAAHPGQEGQALSGSVGCGLQMAHSGTCVEFSWAKQPTDDETGNFTITFRSAPGAAAFDPTGSVAVHVWMPSMGHGSAPVHIEKVATGVYNVSNVFFSMPGEWEIRIQLKNGSSVADQAILRVTH